MDSQLEDIEEFARIRRSFIKRFINSNADVAKIADYRQTLNHALATFGVSGLSVPR